MKLIFLNAFVAACFYYNTCYSLDLELSQNSFNKVQTTDIKDSSLNYNRQSFFGELFTNISIQAQAPFKIKKKDALYVVAGVGFTMGLIFIDQSLDNSIRPISKRYNSIGKTSNYVTEIGGNYGFGLCAAFAGFSFLQNNEKGIQTSRLLAQSLITVTLWTRFAKFLAGRERPLYLYDAPGYDTDDSPRWSGPFKFMTKSGRSLPGSSNDAFPSGHTAIAFAIATVFANQYSDHAAIPVIAYSLATVVGFSRMIDHEHWASDVFAGACLGYLCAKQVCNHALNYKNNRRDMQCYVNYMNHSFIAGCSLKF